MKEGVFERVAFSTVGWPHWSRTATLHRRPVPHRDGLLILVHPLGHDLVDRTLDERGRDRFAASTPGGVVHQRAFVPLEVGEQLTDVPLETPDTGDVMHLLTPRPAAQGREFAPASRPAPMPQAPLRTSRPPRRPRPRAARSACSKRTAACHQSSTTVAFGSAARSSPALPCLPARAADVVAFLAAERGRGVSATTIDLRCAAIRYLHLGLPHDMFKTAR